MTSRNRVARVISDYIRYSWLSDPKPIQELLDPNAPLFDYFRKYLAVRAKAGICRASSSPPVISITEDRALASFDLHLQFKEYSPTSFKVDLELRPRPAGWLIWSHVALPHGIRSNQAIARKVDDPNPRLSLSGYVDQMGGFMDSARLEAKLDVETAFRAVVKWYRYLQVDPILDAAIILSTLCSPRAWMLASEVASCTSLGLDPATAIASVLEANVRHARRFFQDTAVPWGSVLGMPTAPNISLDEMMAFRPMTGWITGSCGSLQYLNTVMWRLSGVSSEDILQLRLLSDLGMHEITCAAVSGRHYLGSAEYILTGGRLFLPFIDPGSIKLYAMYNDSWYWDLRGRTGFAPQGTIRRFVSLLQDVSPLLSTDSCSNQPDDGINPVNPPTLRPGAVWAGSCEMTQDVYRRGASMHIAALARYARQGLFVAHPEAYILACDRGPLVSDAARELKKADDVISLVCRTVTRPSIYLEPDRIMYPDQCLAFSAGGPFDKGLLAWALLRQLGLEPSLLLGVDARGHREAYISYQGSGTYVRTSDWSRAGARSCRPVLEFLPLGITKHWANWQVGGGSE